MVHHVEHRREPFGLALQFAAVHLTVDQQRFAGQQELRARVARHVQQPPGLLLVEVAPGVTVDEVRAATGPELLVPTTPAVMRVPATA